MGVGDRGGGDNGGVYWYFSGGKVGAEGWGEGGRGER